MPEPDILRLDDYKERREQRLRLAASLYRSDPVRSELLGHLAKVAALLGSDRAATVWIDEYGPGLVHPHVVLDLLSDRPRRNFMAEPLRRAWEGGVPGFFHTHGAWARGESPGWTVAVALGSDGTRSWFLVADAAVPGRGFPDEARERLMFLSGECSAVVLHRDLDAMAQTEIEGVPSARPRFAGWPILQDIEGREDDETESRRIAMRFLVARLPRLLVEDDLAIPVDRLRQQAERAREEVDRDAREVDVGAEGPQWEEVLAAFQVGDLERLGGALVSLGETVESRLHLHGAAELYRTAYEIFAATGNIRGAVDAARFTGRALRRLARWDESIRWYGIAREVAAAGALSSHVALVMDGLASLHRERGNLPAARATLLEALPYAEAGGTAAAVGNIYLGLASAEHVMDRLDEAMASGWRAVRILESQEDRVIALAVLGGILIDTGDLEAASDAWRCVRDLALNDYYKLYAVDALGHIAALRGDRAGFARAATAADAMGWDTGPLSAKAEILYYRGASYAALGETRRARVYLEKAVAFADEHRFSRTLFLAEAALRALESAGRDGVRSGAPLPVPEEVSDGLRGLRRSLEPVGSPG